MTVRPKPSHLGPVYAAQFADPSVVAAYHLRPPYPPETLAILLGLIGEGPSAVLDVCCGTGSLARGLALPVFLAAALAYVLTPALSWSDALAILRSFSVVVLYAIIVSLLAGRGLVCEPQLLMMDEISMGLAPIVVDQLFEAVAALRAQGTTILLVEQYLTHALHFADICYVLSKGEVAFVGEPNELRDPEVVSRYLGVAAT